jgi:hypothetical protein
MAYFVFGYGNENIQQLERGQEQIRYGWRKWGQLHSEPAAV